MEPRIQYAKTSDGVNIAFWTLGEGSPLVYMPPSLIGHCQLEWQWPEWRAWYQRLAKGRMLIRYDYRGSGLSDRDVNRFSIDTEVLDLEAVVDRLGLSAFNLFGNYTTTPGAIAFAVSQPARVLRLILWNPFARFSDLPAGPLALAEIGTTDWELMTESIAPVLLGRPEGDVGSRYAAFFRQATTPEVYMAFMGAIGSYFDFTDLLPGVACPALVLHRRQVTVPPLEAARHIASGIADARLMVLEGASREAFFGDTEAVAVAIDEFLGEGEVPGDEPGLPSGTAIILFADIVDSTALTERLGDDVFREKARGLDEAMRAAIRENGGTPVEGKTLGDGVLAVFGAAHEAIACASACHAAADGVALTLHVGVHAGDVIREQGNVFGGAVNIAARVAAASAAGETLVSGTVRDLARTSAGVTFEDRGEQALKGIDDPVRVFAVRQA
jgi:class 3 adenylate cyclase